MSTSQETAIEEEETVTKVTTERVTVVVTVVVVLLGMVVTGCRGCVHDWPNVCCASTCHSCARCNVCNQWQAAARARVMFVPQCLSLMWLLKLLLLMDLRQAGHILDVMEGTGGRRGC